MKDIDVKDDKISRIYFGTIVAIGVSVVLFAYSITFYDMYNRYILLEDKKQFATSQSINKINNLENLVKF